MAATGENPFATSPALMASFGSVTDGAAVVGAATLLHLQAVGSRVGVWRARAARLAARWRAGWAPPRRKRQWPLFAASVGHRKRGRAGAEPGAVAVDAAAADASSARNLHAAAWLGQPLRPLQWRGPKNFFRFGFRRDQISGHAHKGFLMHNGESVIRSQEDKII